MLLVSKSCDVSTCQWLPNKGSFHHAFTRYHRQVPAACPSPATEAILQPVADSPAPACEPTLFSPAMAQILSSFDALGATPSGAGPASPPISSILPLLSSAFSTGFSAITFISGFFHTISRSLLSPFLVVIPVVVYLLSPIIISSQIIFDALVGMPFRAAVYVLQALYPLYAFLGVACLSGIILGMGARQIVSLVGWGLLGGEAPSTQRSGSPPRTRPQRKSSASRGKKRVTVKAED